MVSKATPLKKKVLVVEDDPVIRGVALDIVGDAGFEAIEASSADEAVYILETPLDIRIVFTDIDMPGSLDGMKLAACIRERWPPIEIIITSGQGFPKGAKLPLRAKFIAKPYLVSRITELLHQMAL